MIDGKNAFVSEENPSNRTVEVIPFNEPTIVQYDVPKGIDSEVVKSDEPKIVERVIVWGDLIDWLDLYWIIKKDPLMS